MTECPQIVEHHFRALLGGNTAELIKALIECIPTNFLDLVDVQLHGLWLGAFRRLLVDDSQNLKLLQLRLVSVYLFKKLLDACFV